MAIDYIYESPDGGKTVKDVSLVKEKKKLY